MLQNATSSKDIGIMKREQMLKIVSAPFIDGVDLRLILTKVLDLSPSRARNLYHDMREKYTKEAKAKDVIVFGKQIPTSFALDYFQRIGITKDYLLSKVS